MTFSNIHSQNPSLVEGPGAASKPSESMIAQVASDYGVHPLKQLFDILRGRWGSQKLGANEYYDLRLFDPGYSAAEKAAFLGQGAINALNLKINPDKVMDTKNFVGNKLVYTAHLNGAGIASTQTQGFVARQYDAQADYLLKDEAALTDFLTHRAAYPVFGKPQGGSLSVGSVRIEGLDGETLRLGNGNTVTLAAFVDEVFSRFPDGYLLQTALVPHDDMTAITGHAIGSLRVVTTKDRGGARPLYCLWKIPGPDAMSDNFWQDGSMLAPVDITTGEVTACRRGKGLSAEDVKAHPGTHAPIVGTQIPDWPRVVDLACAAHNETPDLGICGFDIAVTNDGPIVIECNDQPNHMLFQYANRTGVMNPDFAGRFQELARRA